MAESPVESNKNRRFLLKRQELLITFDTVGIFAWNLQKFMGKYTIFQIVPKFPMGKLFGNEVNCTNGKLCFGQRALQQLILYMKIYV